MEFDYKKLLKAYIAYVGCLQRGSVEGLSDPEYRELQRLNREVEQEWFARMEAKLK